MKRILKIILLLICFSAMCFFSYKIIKYIVEEQQNKKLNNELIELAVTYIEPENMETEQTKTTVPIQVDFSALKEKNSDIVGWIYIEDSQINLPVVQTTNNDYYLNRAVNNAYNGAGTLFMDYRNNKNMEDWCTIIYGHNMKNGTMFGTLTKYENEEYYKNHTNIYYITENKNYKINLVAGYVDNDNSIIYYLPTLESNKQKIINNAINNSCFNSENTIENDDKIIVLSTCSYEYANARFLLIGTINEL